MMELGYKKKSLDAWGFEFHSHDEYEIYYFHHGACTYVISDRIYTLLPGDLIIMHGMTLHRPNPDPEVEYCRTHIHFDPRYVKGIFRQPDMTDLLLPFHRLKNHRFRLAGKERQTAVESLLGEMALWQGETQAFAKQRCLVLFLHLLIEICEEYQSTGEGSDSPTEKEANVQHIISLVDKNYAEDLCLDRIAEELHLSKFYLAHTFKEVTGVTIMSYLMNVRVNQAKISFWLDRDLSVTETAYRVGFKHPAHFSRVFKQKTGSTAEQYRKRVRSRQCRSNPV